MSAVDRGSLRLVQCFCGALHISPKPTSWGLTETTCRKQVHAGNELFFGQYLLNLGKVDSVMGHVPRRKRGEMWSGKSQISVCRRHLYCSRRIAHYSFRLNLNDSFWPLCTARSYEQLASLNAPEAVIALVDRQEAVPLNWT